MKIDRLTRPVAPQQASRASSISTDSLKSSLKYRAALAPVIPLPIITVLAYGGNSGVDRCPKRKLSGSECQNDLVELGVGSGHGWTVTGMAPMDSDLGNVTDCSIELDIIDFTSATKSLSAEFIVLRMQNWKHDERRLKSANGHSTWENWHARISTSSCRKQLHLFPFSFRVYE